MAKQSKETLLKTFVDQAHQEAWLALIAPLGAITLGATLYYKHLKHLGEDDLFPGYRETLEQMKNAQSNPGHLFYPIPPRRIRSQPIIETLQRIGEEKPVVFTSYPLLVGWEWTLGKIHLQLAVIENPTRATPSGFERIRLAALVGDNNALHKIEAENNAEARPQIERIIGLHNAGARALAAVLKRNPGA